MIFIALYRIFITLAMPFVYLLLWVRRRRGKEDAVRLGSDEARRKAGHERSAGQIQYRHGDVCRAQSDQFHAGIHGNEKHHERPDAASRSDRL